MENMSVQFGSTCLPDLIDVASTMHYFAPSKRNLIQSQVWCSRHLAVVESESILLEEIKYISKLYFKKSQANFTTASQLCALAICYCKLHYIKRNSTNLSLLVLIYHRYSTFVSRSCSECTVTTFRVFTCQ